MVKVVGIDPTGKAVHAVRITGGQLTADFLSFGASLQSLRLAGVDHSLVLGYENAASYFANPNLFGSIVGRYANRIAGASARIGGAVVKLDANNLGRHHIHGGRNGASFRNWKIEEVETSRVVFSKILPDGHMGFPGNMCVRVTYQIRPDDALQIEIEATTDRLTLCNFTSHSYYNLDGANTIAHHSLQIDADHFVATDSQGIPIENPIRSVSGEMDFRSPKLLSGTGGVAEIDASFCLPGRANGMRNVARLTSELSGISLEFSTTEPGLQVYTGGGHVNLAPPERQFAPYGGVALEPQIWPDSPNQPGFPSALLRPDEVYRNLSVIRVSGARP